MTVNAGKSANRTPLLLAWSCVVLYTGLTLIGLILQIVSGRSEGDYGYGESLILAFCLGGMLVIGALIISRRSGHRIGWILCAFPLIWAFLQFSYGYAVYTLLDSAGILALQDVHGYGTQQGNSGMLLHCTKNPHLA
jgi:hypothetical protein